MELQLKKEPGKENLYMEVYHYYKDLIMEKKTSCRSQNAFPAQMLRRAEIKPYHH